MKAYPLIVIGTWITIVLIISICCRKYFPKQKELSRKITHIGIGPILPIASWLEIPSYIAIPISISITIGLFLNVQFRFIEAIEDINRKSYGTLTYAISITTLLISFWENHQYAVIAGVLVMAFGDGLAGLIGRSIKSPSWNVLGETKSIAGTTTMALITLIIISSISYMNSMPINTIELFSVVLLAVILEQIGPWGIDNLTVPIGVALSLRVLTGI